MIGNTRVMIGKDGIVLIVASQGSKKGHGHNNLNLDLPNEQEGPLSIVSISKQIYCIKETKSI